MNWRSNAIWAVVALLIGVLSGALPPLHALLLLAIGGFGIAALIDVRVALAVTLMVSPFKALLETEIPSLASLPLDIGQILLLLTVVLWLVSAVIRNVRLIQWTRLHVPLLIFILLALPSFWNTISLDLGVEELAKWIEMLIIIAIVLSLTNQSAYWLMASVIAAGCVQALMGIMQFFSESGPASFSILNGSRYRAYGSFGNPDPFAGFMSLCLCITIGALIHQLESFHRRSFRASSIPYVLLALIAVSLLSMGLLFSWSRGAWFGFGMALLVMLIYFPRRWWMRMSLIVTVIAVIAFTFTANIIPASVVSRLTDFTAQFTGYDVRGVLINGDNYALIERLAHWQAALAMAADHPWFGVGLGGYTVAYPRYALVNWPLALGHAHNYYLNLLAETGFVGLAGYLIAIGGIFWLINQTCSGATRNRALAIGILGSWIGLSVHNAFDMLYVNNMFIHVGVLLGLIARYKQPPRNR
jgi:putative inorganic carbon (HCO3(-)) transporter